VEDIYEKRKKEGGGKCVLEREKERRNEESERGK
jgi:hypothetical protein